MKIEQPWIFAALSLTCAVVAAYLQGGLVAALGAASAGFGSVAGISAYTGAKPVAAK